MGGGSAARDEAGGAQALALISGNEREKSEHSFGLVWFFCKWESCPLLPPLPTPTPSSYLKARVGEGG